MFTKDEKCWRKLISWGHNAAYSLSEREVSHFLWWLGTRNSVVLDRPSLAEKNRWFPLVPILVLPFELSIVYLLLLLLFLIGHRLFQESSWFPFLKHFFQKQNKAKHLLRLLSKGLHLHHLSRGWGLRRGQHPSLLSSAADWMVKGWSWGGGSADLEVGDNIGFQHKNSHAADQW